MRKIGLSETTLLFLSNLEVIRWHIDEMYVGEIRRIKHSEHHTEVQKLVKGKTIIKSHFLCFSDAVNDLNKLCVTIAYKLKFRSKITSFNANKPLDKQMRIVPVNKGQVAVFFPAKKETSNLRYHLHGPFVPELSRASIKDTPVNEPLFKQLATLTASSLHKVQDLNLLTNDFLGVLPNSKDEIPERYQLIWKAVIEEMNNKQLTPTYTKKYEPARHLLQGKASLKALLTDEDLEFLMEYDKYPFKWAIGPRQKNNNVDHFLNDLAITNWDIESFINMLKENTSETFHGIRNDSKHKQITSSKFMNWLSSKSENWHQDLYTLIDTEYISGYGYTQTLAIEQLKHLKIIRLRDGSYSIGSKCYFSSGDAKYDELLPSVAIGLYSSGKNKERVKHFLTKIGVHEIGETERIETILKKRYTRESFNPDMNDFNSFIAFVERNPQQAKIFADYHIFKTIDNKWVVPRQIFLDTPFLDTGLNTLYDIQSKTSKRMALHPSYQNCETSLERIVKFAKDVGAQTNIEIEKVSCKFNPDIQLVFAAPGNPTENCIDLDYTINGLKDIINIQNETLSSIIWKTLCNDSKPKWITARYRNNSRHPIRSAPSQLISIIQNAAWVPQMDGQFVRPCEASSNLLPEGFQFNDSLEWFKAVHFGEEIQKFDKENDKLTAAMELGFSDQKSLDDGKWFANLTEQERQHFKYQHQIHYETKLPNKKLVNPERRSNKVRDLANSAPERRIENKNRSISVNRDPVKKETTQYLRQQYTNDDGQMICQVCKTSLPFKLSNGNYYFEKVEFLPEMNKHYYQNYLALCPNHAAMFDLANDSSEMLKDKFIEIDAKELEIVLAQKNTTIYFTDAHIVDLKEIIKADK